MKKRLLYVLLSLFSVCFFCSCESGTHSVHSEKNTGGNLNEENAGGVGIPLKKQARNRIWVGPASLGTGGIREDYVDMLTDKSKWSTVFEKTSTTKLYIEFLYRASDDDLGRIAQFVKENELAVAVEVGGIRIAPAGTQGHELGVQAAKIEYAHLANFIRLGGHVNYITTDHSMSVNITGLTDYIPNFTLNYPDFTMQDYMVQQIEYFKYMQGKIPGLKCGAIESLGFFWVKGDKQYQATRPDLLRLDFEYYFSEYVRIAKAMDFELDHFHIDFGMHDVEHDGGGLGSPHYGRVIAVEQYVKSQGVKAGFIAANCFRDAARYGPFGQPANDADAADRSASERTLEYFEKYMLAGGESDTLIFQRWQDYPRKIGDEHEPCSNFGIFKAMVESEWFPE